MATLGLFLEPSSPSPQPTLRLGPAWPVSRTWVRGADAFSLRAVSLGVGSIWGLCDRSSVSCLIGFPSRVSEPCSWFEYTLVDLHRIGARFWSPGCPVRNRYWCPDGNVSPYGQRWHPPLAPMYRHSTPQTLTLGTRALSEVSCLVPILSAQPRLAGRSRHDIAIRDA